jgi:hemolysin III
MTPPKKRPKAPTPARNASHAEHRADMLSHGLALLVVLAALPLLLNEALRRGDPWWTFGVSVFGISMALLYLASMLYHAFPYHGPRRERLRTLDQMAIFLLIAGTYTPFTLGALRGVWGWLLFGLVWTLAIIGITLKAWNKRLFDKVSLWLYVGMGWCAVLVIVPTWNMIPLWGMIWLLLGGIAYTTGVLFFVRDHRPYYHFIWHVFVAIGSACHFIAVFNYSA